MIFKTLESATVENIHKNSLEVLAQTGIAVDSDKALELLKASGVRVTSDGGRHIAFLPERLVEESLKTVPRSYVLYGRGKGVEARFERGNPPLFGPSGVPHLVFENETCTRRQAGINDYLTFVKLLDGLSNVDFISPPCTFTDLPEETIDFATFFHLSNTTLKPFSIDFSNDYGFRAVLSAVEILKESVYGGKPFVQFGFCPVISPLRLDHMGTDQLIDTAKAGIPVAPISMAQSGVSAPVTLAGTLTLMNAEVLSVLVVSQLARPGAPFLYGTIPGSTNFMTGDLLTASPELPLLNAAATQMADYYGIPNWATAGRTDSKMLDIQAGYEQASSIPWVALAGATYISAVGGFLQSVNVLSLEKFVIDNEVVGLVKRILKGIGTDDDHFALGLIHSVGPGGNFLAEAHTARHMRSEFHTSQISENSYWEAWLENGKPDALQRARKKADDIISSHAVPPLPDDIARKVKSILPNI